MTKEPLSVAVIGAGLGGMACAARLARAGLRVTVFEKNADVGGKMKSLELEGFVWDTGPSLLTMPEVLTELWRDLGADLADDLDLIALPSTCRYRWADGTQIDEDEGFWNRPDVARFLDYAAGLYEISADAFLYHRLEDWWRQLTLANLPKLRHFPKIASPRSLHSVVTGYFQDPHLVQLFDRFATYNGSSPWRTPSAFNIIPYVQRRFGGWYPRGGMVQIARALRRQCARLGVEFRFGSEIRRIEPGFRVWQESGEADAFDRVVCNEDVLTAHETILPETMRAAFRRSHLDSLDVSMSGLVLFVGVGERFPGLQHHNIFFSDDYRAEFRQLEAGQPADEPTIYIADSSLTEPGRAPEGCDNWFVLVNMPAGAAVPEGYADRILQRLEARFGFAGLRQKIRVLETFGPADFARRDNAWKGALYGFASHGSMAAFRRPVMEPKALPGFHFVGGTTHPGGGVPLVLLSGKIAAERILSQG